MRAAQSNCGPRPAAQGRRSSGGRRVGAIERARVVMFAVRVRPPTVHRASGGGGLRARARKIWPAALDLVSFCTYNYARLWEREGRAASLLSAPALVMLLLLRYFRSAWHGRRALDGRRAAAPPPAAPPTRAARQSMIRVAARAERRSTRRARRGDDDSTRRAAAASRRDDTARAVAAEDAARGARRIDGRTQRLPRRVRGRSRLYGRRRARDDGRADTTPFAQPRVCPSRASSVNAACAAAAPR